MDVFVQDYDWNVHWNSVDEVVEAEKQYGAYSEGHEFTMVRLTVGASTTYRICDGRPVPVAVNFPVKIE